MAGRVCRTITRTLHRCAIHDATPAGTDRERAATGPEAMLQDPAKDVLSPLSLAEAEALGAVPVGVSPADADLSGGWHDLSFEHPNGRIALKDYLPLLAGAAVAAPDYGTAFSLILDDRPEEAAAQFLALAVSGTLVAASLYGFALAVAGMERFLRAQRMAEFVGEAPGYTDPRAFALAGHCAYSRNAPRCARTNLAKASRLARGAPEHLKVKKYAQRILLVQQFGTGGES